MSKDFTILTKSEDGKINGTTIKKFFDGLKPGRYELSAKRLNKRSLPQNRYWWGVCVPMVKQGIEDMSGEEFTKEEIHEFLKNKFNYKEIVNMETGECQQIPKSTAGLNKDEFAGFIDKVQKFAAEYLNIVIPDPGQQVAIWE